MSYSKGKQKLKLKLRAFDHRVLDQAVTEIVGVLVRTGAKMSGPVPLPTKITRFTVNRSTHVDKESREQFEIRDHARLLVVEEPSPQIIEALSRKYLPSSVDAVIKIEEV